MAKKKRKVKDKLEKGIAVSRLAEKYGQSMKVFKKWLEPLQGELGEIKGRALTPKQVRIIITHLDPPYELE